MQHIAPSPNNKTEYGLKGDGMRRALESLKDMAVAGALFVVLLEIPTVNSTKRSRPLRN